MWKFSSFYLILMCTINDAYQWVVIISLSTSFIMYTQKRDFDKVSSQRYQVECQSTLTFARLEAVGNLLPDNNSVYCVQMSSACKLLLYGNPAFFLLAECCRQARSQQQAVVF